MAKTVSIVLPHMFDPRPYQIPLLRAFDSGYKRGVQVWHRRSGKEKTDLNLIAKKMMERVGIYYYVFPTFVQGRKVIWDGIDGKGFKLLNHFPKELVDGKPNDTEMKLHYRNGSMFQVVGSDKFDAVMGTNPIGMVFSEYSLQDPICWAYFRPILAENDGWALFNFTPRGENHAYDLHELAKADPTNWFDEVLTVDDTKAIKKEVLAQERAEIIRLYGNDALYQQEYYCSFVVPITGAYYAEQLQQAYKDGRIGNVPHEPRIKVDTVWDLGVNDRMAIWFTQSVGQELRIIDYLEGTGHGLPHYIGLLNEKRHYVYGEHTAPHDIKVRELTSGKTRLETARALGINFTVAPNVPVVDGIDQVRSIFSKCWFDRERTKDGVNALKNYRKQYDEKRKTYLNQPYHDWSSNAADAFRMKAVSLDFKRRDIPAEQPDKYLRSQRERGGGGSPVSVLG